MKTWLITGCSSGFGQRLALAAAERGDQVIATARNVEAIRDMALPFEGRMIALPLDVTDAASVRPPSRRRWRLSAASTSSSTMPAMACLARSRRARPRNIARCSRSTSSASSRRPEQPAGPEAKGWDDRQHLLRRGHRRSWRRWYYNAAKFAVEGLSEALADELTPFGIRVMIVEPGPFRTEFLGRSITMAAKEMPEYAASSRRHYRETNNGNQAGDPDKAMAVILQAVDAEEPPLHLPLGPVAHGIAERNWLRFARHRRMARHFDHDGFRSA